MNWQIGGCWSALALGLLLAGATAQAAPHVPAHDDEVVERLPARPDAEQRARRAALARDPRQLPLALAVAHQAVLRSRREGDPRELGAAQAALAPWWSDAQAPAPVQLLRATILQSRHDFDAARLDLGRLLARTDTDAALRAQALLTRAQLLLVLGQHRAASADCEALQAPAYRALGEGVQRAARACSIELRSLLGDPRQARAELDQLAANSADDIWLALLRAELAERLGDERAAPRLFAAAAQGGEVYALAAWADWLLDRGREREALDVLARGPQGADALLLRRAIAWQRLGDPKAAEAVATLRARFAAARQRGDAPHAREEARLALDIERDAARALALARTQWAMQKEPADAVLLWRAARAAGQPGVAVELHRWLPDPAAADVRLADLPGASTRPNAMGGRS